MTTSEKAGMTARAKVVTGVAAALAVIGIVAYFAVTGRDPAKFFTTWGALWEATAAAATLAAVVLALVVARTESRERKAADRRALAADARATAADARAAEADGRARAAEERQQRERDEQRARKEAEDDRYQADRVIAWMHFDLPHNATQGSWTVKLQNTSGLPVFEVGVMVGGLPGQDEYHERLPSLPPGTTEIVRLGTHVPPADKGKPGVSISFRDVRAGLWSRSEGSFPSFTARAQDFSVPKGLKLDQN